MLVSVSAARADGFYLTDWPWLAPAVPATTGIFPRLPENWSDLPLQLHLTEQVGYNSNVLSTPTGTGASSALYGRPISSLESISTYGASFKNEIGAHQLFADASWGMYRYAAFGRDNSAHSSADIGDNFTGSKCKGTLRASEASSPSAAGQQISYNVINTTTTVSINENAQCIVTGEYSGIFNSGVSTTKNSALLDKTSDNQTVFLAAGIEYSVSETNSYQVLATITGIDYTDRQINSALLTSSGLTGNLTTDQINATYTKNFGPDLAVIASVGAVGVVLDQSFGLQVPRTILPQYSLSAQWTATPKFSLNASVSRSASPPTSIISNLQVTEAANAGFSYHWTPKLALSGNIAASYSSSVQPLATNSGLLNPLTQNQKTFGGGLSLSYAVTPFLGSQLSYQYTKSVQSTLTTNTSLILLALNFNPF